MNRFSMSADQRERYDNAYDAYQRWQAIKVHFRQVQRNFDALLRERHRGLIRALDEIENLYRDFECAPVEIARADSNMQNATGLMSSIARESEDVPVARSYGRRKLSPQEKLAQMEAKLANLKAQLALQNGEE